MRPTLYCMYCVCLLPPILQSTPLPYAGKLQIHLLGLCTVPHRTLHTYDTSTPLHITKAVMLPWLLCKAYSRSVTDSLPFLHAILSYCLPPSFFLFPPSFFPLPPSFCLPPSFFHLPSLASPSSTLLSFLHSPLFSLHSPLSSLHSPLSPTDSLGFYR